MEVYRTEEEQVEVFKKFFKEYAVSIGFGIALAIAIVYGWNYWKDQRQNKGEQAASVYHQILDLNSDEETTSEDISEFVKQLKQNYQGSTYAFLAGLQAAKRAIDDGNLDVAQAELQWVLDNSQDDNFQKLARLRLSRVLHEKGESEKALTLIENVDSGEYISTYEEVKGDIYASQNQLDKALAAYQKATEATKGQARYLNIKLDDIRNQSGIVESTDSDNDSGNANGVVSEEDSSQG